MTLKLSSQDWHQGKHEPWTYVNFLLYTLLDAYKEFERRVGETASPRGEKRALIEAAVDGTTGSFSVADLQRQCPGVSLDMIRYVLKDLRENGKVECIRRGRTSLWKKTSD